MQARFGLSGAACGFCACQIEIARFVASFCFLNVEVGVSVIEPQDETVDLESSIRFESI